MPSNIQNVGQYQSNWVKFHSQNDPPESHFRNGARTTMSEMTKRQVLIQFTLCFMLSLCQNEDLKGDSV